MVSRAAGHMEVTSIDESEGSPNTRELKIVKGNDLAHPLGDESVVFGESIPDRWAHARTHSIVALLALIDGEPTKDFSSACGHTHSPDAMVLMLV
jgi:hypothetical protein